jgi:23S rRNA (adenine2503-C2)-methyltransferase
LDIPFGEWGAALELPAAQAYRARQVQEWVFMKRAKAFAEMTNLPAALRTAWEEKFKIRSSRPTRQDASKLDGTVRLFFETLDGKPFSAVFLPGKAAPVAEADNETDDGAEAPEKAAPAAPPATADTPFARAVEKSRRYALCISTQVGCAWGCVFCASGRVAFERNLSTGEILDQVFWAEELTGKKVTSLLFMGMGEPLANYANVLSALRTFRSPLGFNFGSRHVTVSTCGLVPQIEKLTEEAPKINLAISLHAADDETRKKILPKSSHWPIKDLLKSAWGFQRVAGEGRVTFEYILLKGVNDSVRSAQRLSNLLRDKGAWVNLIVYNPVAGLPYEAPDEATVDAFAKVLTEREIFVRVRKPQGRDIQAGCGQLGAPQAV